VKETISARNPVERIMETTSQKESEETIENIVVSGKERCGRNVGRVLDVWMRRETERKGCNKATAKEREKTLLG